MFRRDISILESSSFFLFGSRGTGKTTLLKELFGQDKTRRIDLLDPKERDRYLVSPESLLHEARASGVDWIIVDEVQKVSALYPSRMRIPEFMEGGIALRCVLYS